MNWLSLIFINLLGFLSLCVLIYFIMTINNRKRKKELINKISQEGGADFKTTAINIALGMSKGNELYRKLIIQAHPDKFSEEKKEEATLLSQKIVQAKRNYNELLKLEIDVEQFVKK